MFLASALFLLTLLFVIWQPRGLQIGTTAIIGAVTALLLGVVSFYDVLTVTSIVWDATLAFTGIIILSMVLDEIGFFEWAAIKMAYLSGGNGYAMFILSWFFLAILMGGYVIGDLYHIPISLFALGGALLFLALASFLKATNALTTIKTAPWQVVWFSIGLYVVVYGLKNVGLTDELAKILLAIKPMGEEVYVMATGFISAFLSAVMNNLPTIMIMDIAIDKTGDTFLAYANILGCNLGPKMTPIGSLATLLWLHVLEKKGVKITWGEYMKVGMVITLPVLFIALLGL